MEVRCACLEFPVQCTGLNIPDVADMMLLGGKPTPVGRESDEVNMRDMIGPTRAHYAVAFLKCLRVPEVKSAVLSAGRKCSTVWGPGTIH